MSAEEGIKLAVVLVTKKALCADANEGQVAALSPMRGKLPRHRRRVLGLRAASDEG
jgi:hypothetical protein